MIKIIITISLAILFNQYSYASEHNFIVKSKYDFTIRADDSYVVESWHINLGDTIKKGEKIVSFQCGRNIALRKEAASFFHVAKAKFNQAREMYESNVGRKIDYVIAEKEKSLAWQKYESAKTEEKRCHIFAPFGGVIASKDVDVGAAVDRGETIGRIVDIKSTYIYGVLNASEVSNVSIGVPVTLIMNDRGSEATVEAQISRLGIVDFVKNTQTAELITDAEIRYGSKGRIRLQTADQPVPQ